LQESSYQESAYAVCPKIFFEMKEATSESGLRINVLTLSFTCPPRIYSLWVTSELKQKRNESKIAA
jgi:hypothetical protein